MKSGLTVILQAHGDPAVFALPGDEKRHHPAPVFPGFFDTLPDLFGIGNRLLIDLDDKVPRGQAFLRSRPFRVNLGDENALGFLGGVTSEQLQISGGRVAFDSLLNYLESRGIARTLSNPTLTVLSGELARFQVGGQVPVPEAFSPAFGTGGSDSSSRPSTSCPC